MNYANKGLGYSRQTQCCVPCTAQNRWLKHLSLKSQETLSLLLLTAQLKQLHFRQEKTQQRLQHGVYLLQIVVLLFFKKEKQHKNAIPSWFFFLYFFFFFKEKWTNRESVHGEGFTCLAAFRLCYENSHGWIWIQSTAIQMSWCLTKGRSREGICLHGKKHSSYWFRLEQLRSPPTVIALFSILDTLFWRLPICENYNIF